MSNEHNAAALRAHLFATIAGVRDGSISPASANAISGVAREIIEIDKTAIAYMDKIGGQVDMGLIEEAKPQRPAEKPRPALGFAQG